MIDDTDRLELWLHYATSTRYRQFSAVREEYYYLEEAWEDVQKGRMERLGMLSEESRKRLREAAADGFMDRYVRWLDKNGVSVVTASSYRYPALLKEIPDPPPVLFCKGNLNEDMQLPLAIVGTRRCTDYGKEVAKTFGRELVKAGGTVISGLATGIDGYAALGALSVEGAQDPTVAVLGCGIRGLTGYRPINPGKEADMIYTVDEIKERVAPIADKYHLAAVYLFGSYARREATENSDVDLLVDREGSTIRGMFDMGALYEDLRHSIGKEIDLITMQTLEQPQTQQHSAHFVHSVQRERIRLV